MTERERKMIRRCLKTLLVHLEAAIESSIPAQTSRRQILAWLRDPEFRFGELCRQHHGVVADDGTDLDAEDWRTAQELLAGPALKARPKS